ncbi:uncharacterized protein YgbK (DUF1537 family) [Actinoalloteichus hoggarensis]|uniref:3-oxo-tetronate kinase n=1 Tax=Actinoalloteichus hoggarensis TaxID=1470176 RepID=A0A221W3D3_9PSEU|nr:3-oxo-tetronate kinase [Actinoalloteichus hoggarensis]ASO20318.1 hypothetical protein AHOG_13375 [Actinoalloteichus hoggarensis]MBB5923356.1 uncharacterized protein YgbK (DUF1537 family) [Actinoalloteichus hoggarensis]
MPVLGGIADDFTGATDLATNLVARGLRTVVTLGVPAREDVPADVDAVVIAVKTRTAEVAEAVTTARAALRTLLDLGCERIYDKYCSTFDSTAQGNIGPVMDALLADLDTPGTVVVPAFPATGRTVYQGRLFVGSDLLDESSMRHHPLTPMTESRVRLLLEPQTRHAVGEVFHQTVRRGPDALRAALDAEFADGGPLVVVDAIDDADLRVIAEATRDLPLITGGSGLALGLGTATSADAPVERAELIPVVGGHRAVLAGSASAATRAQVAHARNRLPWWKLDLEALRTDLDAEVAAVVEWARARWAEDAARPVLVYAVDSLADVEPPRADGGEAASVLVERALGRCAARFAEHGMGGLVVAGGETSGTVLTALEVTRLRLGASLSPGVSWAAGTTRAGAVVNLALKSGNFGDEDIFTSSWERLA